MLGDALLSRLNIGPETPLEVTTDGVELRIVPANRGRPTGVAAKH